MSQARRQQIEQALNDAYKLLSQYDSEILLQDDPLRQARSELVRQRISTQIEDLEDQLKSDTSSESAQHFFEQGKIFDDEGNYQQAINEYISAIKLDASNPVYRYYYGNVCKKAGKLREAIIAYTQCISLEPNNSYVFCRRALVHYELKEHKEALADFTNSINLNPRFYMCYNYRGKVFLDLKRYDRALVDFETALEIDPSFEPAINNQALAKASLDSVMPTS